ncbi:MAG TPA: peptidase M22 [Gelria sp.]|jgi:N6-L-threonylcarbamoyladenine synthase|nr:peptidase M22 [Gelria sp.]
MKLYLGIDTSAYTTSLAIVDGDYNIINDQRQVLEVRQGEKGLQQSQALFQHLKNLPFLFKEISAGVAEQVAALAVSAFPRNVEGSYMPVFTAGLSQAQALSSYTGTPLYLFSHQEGHIMAGLKGNEALMAKDAFIACHFSGGTSEVLLVRRGQKGVFDIDITMAGSDLHAGQMVDRVGVAMGLPFPAGKSMEELAVKLGHDDFPTIPSAVKENSFSFSGPETNALKLLQAGEPPGAIACSVFRVIANTLEKCLLKAAAKCGLSEVLLVGGVMANSLIRQRLLDRLEHPAVGLKLYFAEPHLSTDNAVGVAMLAACLEQRGNEHGK